MEEIDAINMQFNKLSVREKHNIISVLKQLYQLYNNAINFLNCQSDFITYIQNYNQSNEPIPPLIMGNAFRNYIMYDKFKQYTNKISGKKIKKLDSCFNHLDNNTKETILTTINKNFIKNLIKKNIKNKTPTDISDLFVRLKNIHPNLVNNLNLTQLGNYDKTSDINNYIDNYNYNYNFTDDNEYDRTLFVVSKLI
jgi:hypothetical protein